MDSCKRLFLARPRGFCAGVRRALETVDNALQRYGPPIYVLHEIVHNEYVVNNYKDKGVVFVECIDEVKSGCPVIFSAHGVAKNIEQYCQQRHLTSIDATCPLVKRIHRDIVGFRNDGFQVVLVGHKMHPEIMGALGQVENGVFVVENLEDIDKLLINDNQKLAFLTQTTLCQEQVAGIIEKLKMKFPGIVGGHGICYATKNRQHVIRDIAELSDVVLIIGSEKSSNSRRLLEISSQIVSRSFLICSVEDISNEMIEGVQKLGITAAASAPEVLVDNVIAFLQTKGWGRPEEIGEVVENTVFPLVNV